MTDSWTVVRSQQAIADLYAIWSYLADRDDGAAARWLDRMDAAFQRLAGFPELGNVRPELPAGLRAFSQPPHIVIYACHPADRTLVIVRVVDGRRDFPGLFV